jgi:hypothetical protein
VNCAKALKQRPFSCSAGFVQQASLQSGRVEGHCAGPTVHRSFTSENTLELVEIVILYEARNAFTLTDLDNISQCVEKKCMNARCS